MTEKQAYELALKLWIWLYQNPGKGKLNSPYRIKIYKMKCHCPLCEYFRDYEFGGYGCQNCTLNRWGTCGPGAFHRWVKNNYNDKPAAAFIASKIRRYMRKKGWLKG